MNKIASPQDLRAEIHRLLAYCDGPGNPSRDRIASELRELADRVAVDKQAKSDLIYFIIPQRDMMKLYDRLENEDEQSAKLFYEVFRKLQDEISLSSGAEEALNRMKDIVTRGQNWDAALLRNNVFKAAHSLGIKLPSGMFVVPP
jgi:hypothetical protein